MKIAFIGLGNMGSPMARNLLKAGHALRVFDIVKETLAKLEAEGARPAASVAAATIDAELVVTMLPSSPNVKQVYLGDEGILAKVRPGVLLIDCSTIDPHVAREVASAAAKQGNPMLDAPVSGGTGGAEAATLTFMVGGDVAAFEAAKPVLAVMGKNVVHCGDAGNGQVAKICNNLILGISMIAVSEAMSLGAALGMDARLLTSIVNTSSGRCFSSDTYNPYPGVMENVPAARGYSGGFGVDLMLKDLGLAVDAAKQSKQPAVMGGVAQQLYQLWSAMGAGSKDFSSIIQLIAKH